MAQTLTPSTPYDPDTRGMTLTGRVPIRFELSAIACGKRRNEVKVGMVQPKQLKVWDIASDEAPFHGGDESAPKPLSLFAAGILTCFMTQMRTFARDCNVEVRGLRANAGIDWTLTREGTRPYKASPCRMQIDIELDTDAPLAAQQLLVRTAAEACFAEATLREPPRHRLRHRGEWVECD